MTIVRINLHKVCANRSLDAKGGQIKINNNVSIKNVEDQFFGEGGSGIKEWKPKCMYLNSYYNKLLIFSINASSRRFICLQALI